MLEVIESLTPTFDPENHLHIFFFAMHVSSTVGVLNAVT